jgi:hypothetical protein
MSTLTAAKLLQYGAVTFIPATSFDTVSVSMTWQGQTLALLEQSDELPGFLGWFTISGMPDPGLGASDPGLNAPDQVEPVSLKVLTAKKSSKKDTSDAPAPTESASSQESAESSPAAAPGDAAARAAG